MKTRFKSLLIAATALLLIASMVGCSLVSVNTDKDRAQIVAKVGDKSITKGAFMDQFEFMLSMYQSFGYDPTTSPDSLAIFQDSILDTLIEMEILQYQAKKQGFVTLSEEQNKDADEQAAEYDSIIYEAALAQAQQALGKESGADVESRANELYADLSTQYFAQFGYVRIERGQMRDWVAQQLCINNMQDAFNEKITVSDEEVAARYNDLLKQDTEDITEDPGMYKDRQETFERTGGTPMLFIPEGYVRVKHILITPEEEIPAAYEANKAAIDGKQEEIRDLKLQDEVANADKISALQKEIETLTAENDKIHADHYAQSKVDAQDAYNRLQNGESFDAVMNDLSADPDFGKDGVATFNEKGSLLSAHESDTDWSAAIKSAVLGLKTPGSYTNIIKDEAGFHILQFVAVEPAGELALAEVKQSIHDETLMDKQADEWAAILEEWSHDTSVVTRYPDLIRSVGAA